MYKVGRTGDIWKRLKKYPKGSVLLFFSEWNGEPLEAVVLEGGKPPLKPPPQGRTLKA